MRMNRGERQREWSRGVEWTLERMNTHSNTETQRQRLCVSDESRHTNTDTDRQTHTQQTATDRMCVCLSVCQPLEDRAGEGSIRPLTPRERESGWQRRIDRSNPSDHTHRSTEMDRQTDRLCVHPTPQMNHTDTESQDTHRLTVCVCVSVCVEWCERCK